MPLKNLKPLFQPGSIVVVGASSRIGSLGHRVAENLTRGTFGGPILMVNPRYTEVLNRECYSSVNALPITPDLAILCAPPEQTLEHMKQLGEKGGSAAVIMTEDPDGKGPATSFKRALEDIARLYDMCWLGPSSAGLQLPGLGLNASWIGTMPQQGKLALVSQSASLAAAALSVTDAGNVGFSSIVSVGDGTDIDEADIFDYLATDGRCHGVLICLTRVKDGARFITAARTLTRLKPSVVLWAGVSPGDDYGEHPQVDHNQICKAAFHRAGLLQVDDIASWFGAVAMFSYARRRVGDRLAIISNGEGPAMLMQNFIRQSHPLVDIDAAVQLEISSLLPKGLPSGNPVNIGVDADAGRYGQILTNLVSKNVADTFIVIINPCRPEEGEAIAATFAKFGSSGGRTILTCWPGGAGDRIRTILSEAGISAFDIPEKTARAYLNLVRYRRDQDALRQIPDQCSFKSSSLSHDVSLSDEGESAEYLRAYGLLSAAIMGKPTTLVEDKAFSVLAAVGLGGGPKTRSSMHLLPLKLLVVNDVVFGRAISVSVGSCEWILLPALNSALVKDTANAVCSELKKICSAVPDSSIISDVLFQVADLLVGFPEIIRMEIPSFRLRDGRLEPVAPIIWPTLYQAGEMHLAFHPYPRDTEEKLSLKDGRSALLRPIRPSEDIPLLSDFLGQISGDDLFLRFSTTIRGVPPELLAKMARVDYDREMGFAALAQDHHGTPVLLGVVDAFILPARQEAEFSILLRSDQKRSGLGTALMKKIISYCKNRKIETLVGVVLKQNEGMRKLADKMGFQTLIDPEDDVVKVRLTFDEYP